MRLFAKEIQLIYRIILTDVYIIDLLINFDIPQKLCPRYLLLTTEIFKHNLVMHLLNILFLTVFLTTPCRSTKVSLSSHLTSRTTTECALSALKRFPRDTEGVLQGRLIVPVGVDGHLDVRDATRGSCRSTDTVRHSTWRQSVSYPVRNCPGTMNRFPPRVRRDYFGRYYLSILSSQFPC